MNKKVILLIIVFAILLGGLSFFYIFEKKHGISYYLKISLNGEDNASIKLGEEYIDAGAQAKYKDEVLEISSTNDIDNTKVGTYSYTYKVNYKGLSKEVVRTINVLDNIPPTIKINGRKNMVIVKGYAYEELGASAFDNYDGEITDITIEGEVDTNTSGTYEVTYKAIDSSDNEGSAVRTIRVVEETASSIPVLNYHFFYADSSEPCHEDLCVNMTNFRQQLDYLRDNGYYTLTIKEFADWMYNEIELPNKSILITIDDGAWGTGKANGNHLIPALEEYDMYATLFLITGFWDKENYVSPNLDVESHTNQLHYEQRCGYRSKVNCVPYETVLADLKTTIDILGTKQAFCFPFYESSDTSVQAVKDAGFRISFAGKGGNVRRTTDKYRIPRFAVHDSTTMDQFIWMVSI